MALVIDPRLLEAEGEMHVTANFNRTLAVIDALEKRVKALEEEPFEAVGVEPEAGTTKMWGTKVSALQSDIDVSDDNQITGTLKYLSSGQLVTDWGAGNFLALKFTGVADNVELGATSVKVGLDPSAGSGLVEIKDDPDQNGAFKITNAATQKFVIETTNGKHTKRQEFDLSGLVCETE